MHHKWRSYDVWFLRDEAWQTEFFVILGHILSFDPPNNLKDQSLEKIKNKKTLEDIIVLHLHTTNDDHIDVWFLRYGVRHTGFFVILDYFLSFYLSNNLKNQNFGKMKKIPIDYIILHMCIINENHMIYGYWDMECNRQNFFLIWTTFYPFTHPNNPENWNFEKWRKTL